MNKEKELEIPNNKSNDMLQPHMQNQVVPSDPTYNFTTKDQDVQGSDCYQGLLHSCGNCCGWLRTFFPCVCCCVEYPYQVVDQSFIGIKERYGKFVKNLTPGLHYVNPCTESIIRMDMKTEVLDLEPQSVNTRDNISLIIDPAVAYRIINPNVARFKIQDIKSTIKSLAYNALRNIVGQRILQEILEKRSEIGYSIQEEVKESCNAYGFKIDEVFIKDLILPKELQETLSSSAKEKRLAESKIISAQSDVQAAKMMKEVSDLLANKSAMQIRYFEVLQNICDGQNPKVIFLPLEIDMDKN